MNEVTKGYQLREQMKKINENVQKDLLDYSETELSKNPKNTFMLTAKVTHQ